MKSFGKSLDKVHQKEAKLGKEATFGSAAENLIFTPPAKSVNRNVASATRYSFVKYTTIFLDYAYLLGAFSIFSAWYSGHNWCGINAAKIIVMNSTGLILFGPY